MTMVVLMVAVELGSCMRFLHSMITRARRTAFPDHPAAKASAVHDGYTPRSSRVMARKVAEAVSTVSVMWGLRCEV